MHAPAACVCDGRQGPGHGGCAAAGPAQDQGPRARCSHAAHVLQTDFFVLSCDSILLFPVHAFADMHRLHDASVSCLFVSAPA